MSFAAANTFSYNAACKLTSDDARRVRMMECVAKPTATTVMRNGAVCPLALPPSATYHFSIIKTNVITLVCVWVSVCVCGERYYVLYFVCVCVCDSLVVPGDVWEHAPTTGFFSHSQTQVRRMLFFLVAAATVQTHLCIFILLNGLLSPVCCRRCVRKRNCDVVSLRRYPLYYRLCMCVCVRNNVCVTVSYAHTSHMQIRPLEPGFTALAALAPTPPNASDDCSPL